jgi:hypothetical protein
LLHVQSLAEWAQARTGLLWEVANAHAEAAVARKVKLQTEVAAACEIQRVKEAIVRRAHNDAVDLKKSWRTPSGWLRTRPPTSKLL